MPSIFDQHNIQGYYLPPRDVPNTPEWAGWKHLGDIKHRQGGAFLCYFAVKSQAGVHIVAMPEGSLPDFNAAVVIYTPEALAWRSRKLLQMALKYCPKTKPFWA